MEIRVYYEDTDSGGVVYYASYLRFMERARTEFFRRRGLEPAAWDGEGGLFMVARAEVDYRAPGRYDDLLEVDTRVCGLRRAGFTFRHEIRRKGTGELLVEGRIRMACVGPDGRPRRLGERVRKVLGEALAGEEGIPT